MLLSLSYMVHTITLSTVTVGISWLPHELLCVFPTPAYPWQVRLFIVQSILCIWMHIYLTCSAWKPFPEFWISYTGISCSLRNYDFYYVLEVRTLEQSWCSSSLESMQGCEKEAAAFVILMRSASTEALHRAEWLQKRLVPVQTETENKATRGATIFLPWEEWRILEDHPEFPNASSTVQRYLSEVSLMWFWQWKLSSLSLIVKNSAAREERCFSLQKNVHSCYFHTLTRWQQCRRKHYRRRKEHSFRLI